MTVGPGASRDQPTNEVKWVSLGGGHRVPYPAPTTPAASRVGKGNKRAGTRPEIALRSNLHRRGLRFRKDFALSVEGRKVRPDIVFRRARLAVFVDGCFWHCCPEHGATPKSNTQYWELKLGRNVQRDRETDAALSAAGWLVVRLWEHEDPEATGALIEEIVRRCS